MESESQPVFDAACFIVWRSRAAGVLCALVLAPLVFLTPAAGQEDPSGGEPIRGFIYVEPFEIRFEVTVELAALQGAGGRDDPLVLGQPAMDRVRSELLPVLRDACRIRVDGAPFVPSHEEIGFIRLDPERGPIPEDRSEVALGEARLGGVFAAPRSGIPEELEIEWRLMPIGNTEGGRTPVEVQVMSGQDVRTEMLALVAGGPPERWSVPDVEPAGGLVEIAPVERKSERSAYVIALAFGALGIVLLLVGVIRRTDRASLLISAALTIVLAGGIVYSTRTSREAKVGETQASAIMKGLLTNIYHAFSFRDESRIFDTLAESVEGDLLEELYLDIRRGLELEEAGGPRVKVLRVELVDCAVLRSGADGVRARVVWVSTGDVSHWGHSHRRRNQYRGEFRLEDVEGRWKVTDVDILEEERT